MTMNQVKKARIYSTALSTNLRKPHITVKNFNIEDLAYIKELKLAGKKYKKKKKSQYINIPAALDLETSSFYEGEEKRACMYCWTVGIDGLVIFGRTWVELVSFLNKLSSYFNLNDKKRLLLYVHNLSFDFQFFRKWFNMTDVFAVNNRQPLYAMTGIGIEFRCSYLLSGYSLNDLGKNLKKYHVRKMTGDLDYTKIRTSDTPMSRKEVKYACNDVRVVMAYIQEEIEHNGDISKIPLTKTGYVRKFCRENCLCKGVYGKYMSKINNIGISLEEYKQLKRAFQGGFTHASAWKVGKVYTQVHSFDFTSSYPAVMVCEKFPMSEAEIINIKTEKQFWHNLKCYCCVFDICFEGLESKTEVEHPLSGSRCYKIVDPVYDNGRVVSASLAATTMTDVDMQYFPLFYSWKKIRIANFRRYVRGYLPTPLIQCVLSLYHDKTALKGVKGEEGKYIKSKGMVNSCYGMMVTDILRNIFSYENEEWQEPVPDEKGIEKYLNSKTRFLCYQWGIFVTAYARRNLFSGINSLQTDYIYSDTDSVKFIHYEKHKEYFEKYNEWLGRRITAAMKFHGLDEDLCYPKTIKGKVKMLGAWDDEGEIEAFKTLGAKRYMYRQNGETYITVAGLGKSQGKKWLQDTYGSIACFEKFSNNMKVPPEYSGRMTHTYIDDPHMGTVIDYLGNEGTYYEKSGVHLEVSSYDMSMSEAFLKYLRGIEVYYDE